MRKPYLLLFVCAAATVGAQPPRRGTFTGHVRTYYLAADELDWTYIPARADQALSGKKDDFASFAGSKGTIDPNATTYKKVLYREYTDSTFRTLKPRADAWSHLGILGPVIRGEVGDSINVVF